jgi:hypothetical protein
MGFQKHQVLESEAERRAVTIEIDEVSIKVEFALAHDTCGFQAPTHTVSVKYPRILLQKGRALE